MKEGLNRLFIALNKATIISQKNAQTALEMWNVAAD